jgi:hypothetical protein
MRKFIKLIESITDSWEANAEIERGLSGLAQDERTLVLDGLELLYNAGADGMTVHDWMVQMKQLWSQDEEKLRETWKLIAQTFPHFVRATHDGHYVFHHAVSSNDAVDMTSPTAQLATMQIQLTGQISTSAASLAASPPRTCSMHWLRARIFRRRFCGNSWTTFSTRTLASSSLRVRACIASTNPS